MFIEEYPIKRYSISTITQGKHRLYTFTMPSDVLAKCCFVSTRDENPQKGFQRLLDVKRAEDIAGYIDSGFGTIPCSIILSAQSDADLRIIGKGKTLQFRLNPKAFLILDGQHRVFGFSMAKSVLRVPVVVYNGLSRRDETRLFIDINSKQKGVPSELLLDIKRLAEYETNTDAQLRDIYDNFMNSPDSVLMGKCAPSSRKRGMITRVTFNGAVKPLLRIFGTFSTDDVYTVLNSYFRVFLYKLKEIDASDAFTGSIVFRAVTAFFPVVAAKVKDRFGSDYSEDRFLSILEPMFNRIRASRIKAPGTSYKSLLEYFNDSLKTEFSL